MDAKVSLLVTPDIARSQKSRLDRELGDVLLAKNLCMRREESSRLMIEKLTQKRT